MAHALAINALGTALTLQVEDSHLRGRLQAVLADLQGHGCSTGPSRTVVVGGTGPWVVRCEVFDWESTTFDEALGAACGAVNLSAVDATPLLALHCAVLSRGDRTLVIPGRSGLGKSTLTAGLMQRGWAYVSDEALAFDRNTDLLVPYPRPLALSEWSFHTLGIRGGVRGMDGERLLRAADLGTAVARRPADVTDVLLLDPDRAAAPELRTDGPHRADVLAELFRRSFTHHQDVGYALRRLSAVVRGATMHRLTPGPPQATVELVDLSIH